MLHKKSFVTMQLCPSSYHANFKHLHHIIKDYAMLDLKLCYSPVTEI